MPHEFIVFLVIVVTAAAIFSIVSNITSKRRRIAALKDAYGKPPVVDDFFQLDSVSRYARHIHTHNHSLQRVDSITWNDLDMDNVFHRINACQTSVGEEYLYYCLHELPLNKQAITQREGLIQFFENNPETRLDVQALLASRVGKENYNGLTSLMFAPSISFLKHRHLYTFLAIVPLLLSLVLIVSVPIGVVCIVASFVVNMMVYYRVKHHIAIESPSIKYLTNILRCCKGLSRIKTLETQPIMNEIRSYYKSLKSIMRNIPTMTSMTGDIADMFLEYLNIIFLYDIRKYNTFMKTIKERSEEFHALYRAFGEVDMSICISSFRLSLPYYCLPEFGTQRDVEFTDIYHPLIPSPVANTGSFSNNSIITGSNASGKSTFIKAMAINGILAQTINTCAAKSFNTRFSIIATSMVMRDDLTAGDSYFIVEIKSLKRILDLAQKYPCTCFIDEILRGTNTIERIAASAAVLEYLSNQDVLCVAASHDIELTQILAAKYENYHFCEQVMDDGIVFDYKLKQGPSTTRNALKLLKFMDFEGSIVERAESLAKGYTA
ncbi:MAG: hypothetical protein FWC92_02420 [Defluviitaleaceae bacterium]|nr:hypothetical protein [Defluviitaleaceae bacterium]